MVQGITGHQGLFWTERMVACGTRIVAGVSPGKGGHQVHKVPVYDSVAEAASHRLIDVSVLFTPALATREAALDALSAGVRKLVVLAEFVPVQDTMEIIAEARERDAQVIGPNTAGVVTPGQASVGIMPGFAPNIFRPGNVGVISRSGSLGTLICLNIVRAGLGESAFIGIGGDPILGTTTRDALEILYRDPRTEAIVLIGEVGGAMEEEAAEFLSTMSKPVIAFIAGRSAPPGRRMGHAGAIVLRNRGSFESKVRALREAGAVVVDSPSEVGAELTRLVVGHTAGNSQPPPGLMEKKRGDRSGFRDHLKEG